MTLWFRAHRSVAPPSRASRPVVVAPAAVALVAMALIATGCGSATPSGAGSGTAGAKASGPVNVLYAGSLVTLMDKQIGPAFDSATGYRFTGFAAGSTALATEIKGGVRAGDVFISASPTVNAKLTGSGNGDWVSWYATYATSPLVIGYNPHSRFAADLRSKPWYQVVVEPGFSLGSTDPATDPKGKLAVEALTSVAASENTPALKALAGSTANIYPEETLVGRLQSGQLDAGIFYSSEAVAAHIPTVPMTGQDLKASYTITVLNRAAHPAGARAFVAFLLGPRGRAILKQDGFTLVTPPAVTGTGVPAGLRAVLSSA